MVLRVIRPEREVERRVEVFFPLPWRPFVPRVLSGQHSEPIHDLYQISGESVCPALEHPLDGWPEIDDLSNDVAAVVEAVTPLNFITDPHTQVTPGLT